MKSRNLLILFVVSFLISCGSGQLDSQFVYNINPNYTWGYSEFYGAYYADSGIKNNVISLSLFTDSLKTNSIGTLTGLGEYLYLEDLFVNPTDTLLPAGTYTINDTGLPFTISPGKNDTVDNVVYQIGARIFYYEANAANTTTKLIKSGTLTVGNSENVYNLDCNFKTSDNKDLKGTFRGSLPHSNLSLSSQKSPKRLILNWKRK
jgi:hypothetical protein